MSTAAIHTTGIITGTSAGTSAAITVDARSYVPRIPAAQPRLRLTRRGRAVFTSLAAVPIVFGVMMLALNGGGATATSGAPLEQVTLQAGQSLWQLAEELAPGHDPRDVISDIIAVNQLDTASVQAGQRLAVPAAYSD